MRAMMMEPLAPHRGMTELGELRGVWNVPGKLWQ